MKRGWVPVQFSYVIPLIILVYFTGKLYLCKMKRFFPAFSFLLLVFLAVSCQFQHVMKSDDVEKKYKAAVDYYNTKDYSHALQLFDQLMGPMRATDKAQKIYYYYPFCYYGQKDFTLASYYFKRYVTTFPNTPEAEECFFMSAYCNYMNSPEYSLDQTSTTEAIRDLQMFANTYPESKRIPECNELMDKLRYKLEYKDFKISKMYYRMDDYAAAIRCYSNILKEYPDSPHKEEVMFLIFKSSYKYAELSIEERKRERYQKALAAFNDFHQQFPESKYQSEANNLAEKTRKGIASIDASGMNKSSTNK
jgi:outer membrane protein assembly factor BamD